MSTPPPLSSPPLLAAFFSLFSVSPSFPKTVEASVKLTSTSPDWKRAGSSGNGGPPSDVSWVCCCRGRGRDARLRRFSRA